MNKNFLILLTNYRNYLKKIFPQTFSYIVNGDLYIKTPVNNLTKLIFFLKMHSQSQFKVLADICSIDYPWKKNRFQIYYNLLSLTFNSRINVVIDTDENSSVESITQIHSTANWFEREVWDLFGIYFSNNKDLRRILTDYGFKGHPLRKDFPLSGYIEVRYFHNEKRILVEEVSLMQDYRTYYFNNTWNLNI